MITTPSNALSRSTGFPNASSATDGFSIPKPQNIRSTVIAQTSGEALGTNLKINPNHYKKWLESEDGQGSIQNAKGSPYMLISKTSVRQALVQVDYIKSFIQKERAIKEELSKNPAFGALTQNDSENLSSLDSHYLKLHRASRLIPFIQKQIQTTEKILKTANFTSESKEGTQKKRVCNSAMIRVRFS